jgi:hypothetical protein
MTKRRSFHVFVLLLVVSSLLVMAAAPAPALFSVAGAMTKSDLVRLTVDNRSDRSLSISLRGPSVYFLTVQANSKQVFTIQRGEYDYTLYSCGAVGKETANLNYSKTLVMPVCGGAAKAAAGQAHQVDLSQAVKVVKVTFTNEATGHMFVILYGPTTYVFSFSKDSEKSYTINRGEYKMIYSGCGKTSNKMITAFSGAEIELKCPK